MEKGPPRNACAAAWVDREFAGRPDVSWLNDSPPLGIGLKFLDGGFWLA